MISSAFWVGRRIFVTGHTGFKGAWLALTLSRLNARATGYALAPPTNPSLFDIVGAKECIDDIRGDVRDLAALREVMKSAAPEIVIHMAARSSAQEANADPVGTYAANVMGAVNVLEAARSVPSVRAILIVTADDCYENRGWVWGYRETDALGGHDPYSSSKACAELVVSAYRDSFFGAKSKVRVLSARAGNVIGGGDFASGRIPPDALRAFAAKQPLKVRNANAVRPWQHVLEPLTGYLALIEKALTSKERLDGAYNFGPGPDSEKSVAALLEKFVTGWGRGPRWETDNVPAPATRSLRLDTSKARETLQWAPLLDFDQTAQWTAAWYRAFADGENMRKATFDQLDHYLGRRVKLASPFPAKKDAEPALERQRA